MLTSRLSLDEGGRQYRPAASGGRYIERLLGAIPKLAGKPLVERLRMVAASRRPFLVIGAGYPLHAGRALGKPDKLLGALCRGDQARASLLLNMCFMKLSDSVAKLDATAPG